MKYIIEIKELDRAPEDWNKRSSWPAVGLYTVKNESYSLYHVSDKSESVGYISFPDYFKQTPYEDKGESVSEALLLKAIAAASRAEVLK